MDLLNKQIVAWANAQPEWQRDLLRRVARGRLDDESRREVAMIVAGEPGAPAPEPMSEPHLPGVQDSDLHVALLAVRDVRGVNVLAEDQNLRFEPRGLTVVYGNNGSGKSGFGRILRLVCRAVATPEILPNAFASGPTKQAVRVKVLRGEEEADLRLDLAAEPPAWLSAMKIFDGECASEYIRTGNAVERTPEPLGVLSRCAEEQQLVAGILRERAAAIAITTEITATSNVEDVIAAAVMTSKEESELERLEGRLAALGREDLDTVIAGAQRASQEAERLADVLQATADGLGVPVAQKLEELRGSRAAAFEALEQVRREALDGQPVAGTGTSAWREMWESARTFVAGGFPPSQDEPCPLCQRDLDADTAARLARFEAFVTSDLEARSARAERALREVLDGLPDPEHVQLDATQELAGLDSILRDEVLALLGDLAARRSSLAAGEQVAEVRVADVVNALRRRARSEAERAAEHEALRVPEERDALETQVQALRGRRAIAAEAQALREKHRYLAAARRLDTAAITRQHNDLAKLAISNRLRERVEVELERFGGLHGRVEAKVAGSKGRSVLGVRLKGSAHKPGLVLSEGEHRAVAIAMFLAEAAESGGSSTIILEDPVSSFDHQWRDEIGRRLVEEATERQVIVFTHDLGLLNQLSAEANNNGVPFAVRHLVREGERAGIVSSSPPFRQVVLAKRAEELRRRVNDELMPLWNHNRDQYDERVERWMTDLRKSWEMLVEDGLLRGVVRRYDPRIYMGKLKDLRIPEGATEKILAAFGRLSSKAHHEAADASRAPSPERLLELVEEFEGVLEQLAVKQGRAAGGTEVAA